MAMGHLENHVLYLSSLFSSGKFPQVPQTQIYKEGLIKYKGIKGK